MPLVHVKEDESFENAMRRFKRKCEKSGILSELKKTTALREAEREAEAQGDPGSQEDAPQALGGDVGPRRSSFSEGGRRRSPRPRVRRRPPTRFRTSPARLPAGRRFSERFPPGTSRPSAGASRKSPTCASSWRARDVCRSRACRASPRRSRRSRTPAARRRPKTSAPSSPPPARSRRSARALARAESPQLARSRGASPRPPGAPRLGGPHPRRRRRRPGRRVARARLDPPPAPPAPHRSLEDARPDAGDPPRLAGRRRRSSCGTTATACRSSPRPAPASPGSSTTARAPARPCSSSRSRSSRPTTSSRWLGAEERREVDRLLAALGREVLAHAADLLGGRGGAGRARRRRGGGRVRRPLRGPHPGDLGRRLLDPRRRAPSAARRAGSRPCGGARSARHGPRRSRSRSTSSSRRTSGCSSCPDRTPEARPSC